MGIRQRKLCGCFFFEKLLFFLKNRTFGTVELADTVKGGFNAEFVTGGGESSEITFSGR